MPSILPQSIKDLFPNNITSLITTYDDCADWQSTYNSSTFYLGQVFLQGTNAIDNKNKHSNYYTQQYLLIKRTFKNSAKSELIKSQSSGNDEDWPTIFVIQYTWTKADLT